MTAPDLSRLPFYRDRLDARGRVEPWSLDDLEDFASESGDAFGGRVAAGSAPPIALQIEATSEPVVWTALGEGELDSWARGLARIWRRFGLGGGDTIAFFDYGSSPPVLLSSASYVAGLRRGAADRLGATSICNDGVANMTARMAAILTEVRPSFLVIRRDLLAPFADALKTLGPDPGTILRTAVVVEVDGAPARSECARYEDLWKVPVRRLLRSDAAFFLAGDCAECGLFHVDGTRHRLERVGSQLAITNRFAALCPALRHLLGEAEAVARGCPAEPGARRIAWD